MSKENKSKRIFHASVIAVLAATVITASTLAGCGSGEESKTTEKSIVTETTIVTEPVEGVYVDENGNLVSQPTTGAKDSKKSTDKSDSAKQSSQTSAANNAGSGNSGSNKSGSGSNNQGAAALSQESIISGDTTEKNTNRKKTPSNAKKTTTSKSTTKADASAKDLTISGKKYNVGDKVVCTYYLDVPSVMLNFQGRVDFDSSMLKLTGAHLVPPASYGSLMNTKKDGKVIFNGSDLQGYDFTDPGYDFLVVEYEVLKTGATEPSISFEVLTDTNDKTYEGSNGVLSNGASVWTVYS